MDEDAWYEAHYVPYDDALTEINNIAYDSTAGGRYVASIDEIHEALDQIRAVLDRLPERTMIPRPS